MTEMLPIAGWCFVASLLLPVFAWALMPLLPRCAATRHLVWLALFAVLLVLPLLALVVPPQFVLPQAVEAPPPAPVGSAVSPGWSLVDTIPLLIMAWLLGIGFHLMRLALGLFGLYRLRRDSTPVCGAAFEGAQDVRMADEGPLAFGVFHPLILLPRNAANWPQARLNAVLAHERAHLSRRDSLTQTLAQLACALYWPNLLLWRAARSMRHEAEIAADNAVLAAGVRPSDYAAELLQLAGQNLRLPAAAMAAPSLEARVKSVLSPEPFRHGVRAMDAFRIAWLGSAAAVALAFVRPAMAQVQSDPPAPVASDAATVPDPPSARDTPRAPPQKPMHHHHHIALTIDGEFDGDNLTPADKTKIDAAVAQVKATMSALRPEIQRAVQQAQVNRAAAQSVQKAMPQIHAAIAQAMAQIQPAMRQAIADAHVDVQVSAALDRAQIRIDADLARAARDAARASARGGYVHGDAPREPPDPIP